MIKRGYKRIKKGKELHYINWGSFMRSIIISDDPIINMIRFPWEPEPKNRKNWDK